MAPAKLLGRDVLHLEMNRHPRPAGACGPKPHLWEFVGQHHDRASDVELRASDPGSEQDRYAIGWIVVGGVELTI